MNWPQIHIYRHSPNDFLREHLTVSIEYQGMSVPDENELMMVMEKTGRTSIIIEGDKEKISPYLEAVEDLMRKEVTN